MLTTKRIDLHLPTSWKQATTRELEIIAKVMMAESMKMSTYHPFDMQAVKISLFFLLSDIEVCSPIDPSVAVEEQYFECRRTNNVLPWYRRLWQKICRESDEPFKLYLHQIQSVIHQEMQWLDQPCTVLRFPYPLLRRRMVSFKAPSALMQDFTWQRYRYASEFCNSYTNAANRLLRMQKDSKVSSLDLRKEVKLVDNYRSLFLATLFTRKIKVVDDETRLVVNDFAYASNQSFENAKYFRHFPETKFQVILFWWSGMHLYLQKTYPHCFKKSSVRKALQNPLEIYTRTTATMEKYMQMNETEVNRELYTIIFQHLEDMAKESEEMEKMKKKQ